jgi:hypothetical protein
MASFLGYIAPTVHQENGTLTSTLFPRGFEGMQRWVELGVIADNLIQIVRCLAVQRA